MKKTPPRQHAATAGKIGAGNPVRATPLANRHKPWPSRKVMGEEEMVKYMASVPGYLQQLEKRDIGQDKALNCGVIDWGRLEKWTYLQKQVTSRRVGDYPSSSTSSSPFSTSGSSSRSDRNIDSPLSSQRKQSPTLVAHRNSSARDRQTRMMDEQSSVPVMTNPDSKISHDKVSIGHNYEKVNLSSSDVLSVTRNKSPPRDIGRSSCTSKDNDTSAFSHNKVKVQICRSGEAESSRRYDQLSVQGNLHLSENDLSDQLSGVESMWDRLQESFHEGHISCDSTMNNRRSAEANRNSFSRIFPPSDIQFTNLAPHISYSCPLSSSSHREECVVASGPLCENEMLTANAKGKVVKLGRSTDDLSGKLVVNMSDKSSQAEVKVAAAPRRDLSPHRLLRAGLNRMRSPSSREASSGQPTKQTICSDEYHDDSATSNRKGRRSSSPHRLLSAGLNLLRNSSLKEGSSGQQMKETVCSDNSYEDNAGSNVRSRRSPLRRIFDPVKSKNQIPFSGPITSLPSHRAEVESNGEKLPIRDELKSASGACKSSNAIVNNSTIQVTEAGCYVHAEKQVTSTRQALLKLAWKNGVPLFVFSSSDINILAATMGKTSISQNNGFECTYKIFTAHEVKKKVGVWMSQVHKNKKHDLIYNAVGQMTVSSSKCNSDDSKNYFLVREFVLYGGEQISTAQNHVTSLFRNELAAIVTHAQNERPENDNCDILQSSSCRDSSLVKPAEDKNSMKNSQVEQKNENSSLANVVAILPSGVHGTSSTGEPSPLIQRWKSGGSCDCGGWDEGCRLTILTDKIQDSTTTSDRACTTDGSYRIELFAQGETKATKHAFSMVAFKEGVYTVDFGVSISSLQAFAMCITTLHSKKLTTLSGLHRPVEA